MKVLITGGAGYIGHHLSWSLNELGAECYVIDNLSRGLLARVPKGVDFENIDLTDSTRLSSYMKNKNFDVIFHLAGLMQARESNLKPATYELNNVDATVNLLQAITSKEKCKFIFSSSCSVYGNNHRATLSSPIKPLSKYADTKIQAEYKILEAYRSHPMNVNIFRFFNVIGCEERAFACDIQNETLLPASARRIMNGLGPLVFGNDFETFDGFAVRDFVDVRDVVKALILPLDNTMQGIHNLSTGLPYSIGEVLNMLLEIAKQKALPLVIEPKNLSDPSFISAQPSDFLLDKGWHSSFTIQESVSSFWKTFSNYHS
jgi:UDP-glucose 4-epimerase